MSGSGAHALDRVRRWLDEGLRISVAVNLSVRNLNDESFPDRVAEALIAALASVFAEHPDFLETWPAHCVAGTDGVERTYAAELSGRAASVRLRATDTGSADARMASLSSVEVTRWPLSHR